MRKALMTTAMLAVAAALSLTALAADHVKGVSVGQAAPDFKLDDHAGKPVALSDYKGKIVVLEWTNKDCPFVQRHMKEKTSSTLAEKYKASGVTWLQIDSTSDHNTAMNAKTVAEHNLPFPILGDAPGTVGKMYGAKTTPDVFIVNKDGNVVYMGAMDNDPQGKKADRVNYVAKALDEILAGKSVSTPETKSYGCTVKYAK
jgi:peroxiredoxin